MIPAKIKRIVRALYIMRCGYCGLSEVDLGTELTYDHYHQTSLGGTDVVENLVYACHACNLYKSDFWGERKTERLLHPLNDEMDVHLSEGTNGVLIGLTERGRVHTEVLHLNRRQLVAYRLERQQIAQAREEMSYFRESIKLILKRLPGADDPLSN